MKIYIQVDRGCVVAVWCELIMGNDKPPTVEVLDCDGDFRDENLEKCESFEKIQNIIQIYP